jgi:hypothetical protein
VKQVIGDGDGVGRGSGLWADDPLPQGDAQGWPLFGDVSLVAPLARGTDRVWESGRGLLPDLSHELHELGVLAACWNKRVGICC